MDLSFNRKSIFRKSFRQRHTHSAIPPAAASLMKSLKRNQSTRKTLRMSSKLLRHNTNTEKEINFKPGNSCRSPTLSCKFPSINNNDEDELLQKSPVLKRREESFSKLSDITLKWGSSPLKRHVSRVVSVMEKTIWETPKKQVSKLFRRSSSGSLVPNPNGGCMELCGSYKVLVFE